MNFVLLTNSTRRMKKLYYVLGLCLLLFSCQSEENSVNQDNGSALTKTSPLSLLVSRVSQNPTHCDNVLDNSDCYSIKLPVNLTVNGQAFAISNESDFDGVRDNIEASNSDGDVIYFAFPITVVFRDFHQQTIHNQSELDAVNCQGDDFNEIRCLDFVYPISINIYDTNNQVANTVTIDDNYELYHFIQNSSTSDIFTIVYPVTLTLSAGGDITVNSNNELESTIEDSIDDCDNDTGGPGPQPMDLEDIVASGTWHVSFCEGGEGGGGPQNNYTGYNFAFLANGTVTAVKNNVTSNGTWEIYQDGSHKKMELFFANPQLSGLNDDWKVTEYNANNFRLKEDHSGSGGGGGNDYVYFTKN